MLDGLTAINTFSLLFAILFEAVTDIAHRFDKRVFGILDFTA
jgi:hypothetical protein